MKPTEIITMARNQTWTSTGLVPQDEAFTYLNIIEQDFWRDICNDWTSDKLNTYPINLVAWTSTYTLPQSVSASTLLTSTFGLNQTLKVGIKFSSSDTYYTPIQVKYVDWLLNLPDFYAAKTSKATPIAYLIGWDSIVIFPTPDATIAAGLEIVWPKDVVVKTTSTEDVEWMIIVPPAAHMVLVEWLKYLFYGKRGTDFIQIARDAKQFYENEKLRVINQLLNKNILADEAFTLDLTFLG